MDFSPIEQASRQVRPEAPEDEFAPLATLTEIFALIRVGRGQPANQRGNLTSLISRVMQLAQEMAAVANQEALDREELEETVKSLARQEEIRQQDEPPLVLTPAFWDEVQQGAE